MRDNAAAGILAPNIRKAHENALRPAVPSIRMCQAESERFIRSALAKGQADELRVVKSLDRRHALSGCG